MKSYSPNVDDVLLRAIFLSFLGILGSVALVFVLNRLGLSVDDGYVTIGSMIYNIFPTWHIVRAVKMLGKNSWLYGGISIIGIPFSLMVALYLMIPREFHFIAKLFENRRK